MSSNRLSTVGLFLTNIAPGVTINPLCLLVVTLKEDYLIDDKWFLGVLFKLSLWVDWWLYLVLIVVLWPCELELFIVDSRGVLTCTDIIGLIIPFEVADTVDIRTGELSMIVFLGLFC